MCCGIRELCHIRFSKYGFGFYKSFTRNLVLHEFDLIKEYFNWDASEFNSVSHVVKAVGDDAAILEIQPSQQLVTSIDTFISGVHFPENTPAEAIGHKALAVNLSDLAAMGASPRWFTLALTLPEINPNWLSAFSRGMKALAQQQDCFLVGGDTTRGTLSISIQVMGVVEKGKALLRDGAKAGDAIYVTGRLGDAAIGLKTIQDKVFSSEIPRQLISFCQQRLNKPTPRLLESELIRPFASSCIDISDGFLQDLGHILKASDCGAQINLAEIPLSPALNSLPKEIAIKAALTGGDDYELLFTIPQNKKSEFIKNIKKGGDGYYKKIGEISSQSNQIIDQNGRQLVQSGFNHFESVK